MSHGRRACGMKKKKAKDFRHFMKKKKNRA
jgi:hypothetical protein